MISTMITEWITSHFPQLARVIAFCSGVEDPKVNPWIWAAGAGSVNILMIMIDARQKTNIPPQKNNQFVSKNSDLNQLDPVSTPTDV